MTVFVFIKRPGCCKVLQVCEHIFTPRQLSEILTLHYVSYTDNDVSYVLKIQRKSLMLT